jgi:hypothetical protein
LTELFSQKTVHLFWVLPPWNCTHVTKALNEDSTMKRFTHFFALYSAAPSPFLSVPRSPKTSAAASSHRSLAAKQLSALIRVTALT